MPYLHKHGCEGYGHKLHGLPIDWDESKADVEISNQPIRYLVKINAVLFNLFSFKQRPKDWTEFTAKVLALRKGLIEHFKHLVNAFEEYYRKKRNSHLVKDWAIDKFTKQDFTYQVPFPKTISDPTGLVSEGDERDKNNQESQGEAVSILNAKFEAYRKVHNEFLGSLHTFNWQSIKVVLDHYNISEEKQLSLKRSSLVNIIESFSHLNRYQSVFRSHFEKYSNATELDNIENEENELIPSLLYCWKHFVTPSQLYKKTARKEALKIFEKLKTDFDKKLKKKCETITNQTNHLIEVNAHVDIIPNTALLTVDLVDMFQIEDGLEYAISAIKDAVSPCKTLSFKHTMLEMHYSEFWILPTVLNEVFQPRAYKYKLYQFIDGLSGNEQTSVQQFELIDSSIISQLALTEFHDRTGKIKLAEEFLSKYQQLMINVGVACQMIKITQEDGHSEEGKRILTEQVELSNLRIGESFNDYADNLAEQLQFFTEHPDLSQLSNLEQEYFEILQDLQKQTWPIENKEGKEEFEVSMKPESIKEWKERLENQYSNTLSIYIYLIDAAMSFVSDDEERV